MRKASASILILIALWSTNTLASTRARAWVRGQVIGFNLNEVTYKTESGKVCRFAKKYIPVNANMRPGASLNFALPDEGKILCHPK